MKQRSTTASADLQIVIDNKDESLESSDPYKGSKAKPNESKPNFDPKFESYSKLKPINRKDGMPGTLRPNETLQGKSRKQSKVAAKNRDFNYKSQREKSQEAVKAKPLTKKPRLMSASVNSSQVVGASLAKVKPNKGSKKKLKQNNLMAENQKNYEDKRQSHNKSQLDLQTESGQAHVDRNELKAAKFEIANQKITRDPSQDFKLFYANYSNSPTSGWGHLVENQHGLNLQDKPFDASQNEIHVANTLSGSEGYPTHYKQRDRDPNKSDFENNFKSAKNCLYDGGIIQSYCPQQFESPQMKIDISKIQNLDEIMKNLDAQSGQSTTPVDRQSMKTEVIEQPLIEKSLSEDFAEPQMHELQQQVSQQQSSNVQLQSKSDPQTTAISIVNETDNQNSQIQPSIVQSTQDQVYIDEKPVILEPKQSFQSQAKAKEDEESKVVSLQPHNPIQKRDVKLQSDTYTQEFQIQATPRVQPIVKKDPQIVTLIPLYAIQKKDIKLFSDTYTKEFEMPATPQPIQLPKCTAVTRQLSQSAVLDSEEQIIETQSSFNDYQALEDLQEQLQKGQKFTKKVAFVEPIEEIEIQNQQQDADMSDMLENASGPLPKNSPQELTKDEFQGDYKEYSEEPKNDDSEDEESSRSQDFKYVIATLPIITAVSKRFEFVRYHMCDSKSQEKQMLQAFPDQYTEVIVILQIPSITAINGLIVKKGFHQDSGFIFESPINPNLSNIDPILPEKGSGDAIREDQSAKESEEITETASARIDNELTSNNFPVYSALQIPAKFPQPMLSQAKFNHTAQSDQDLSFEQSSPREQEVLEVISYKDSPVIQEKSRLLMVSTLDNPIQHPMQSGPPESEEQVSSINDYKALEDLQKQMQKGQEPKKYSVQDPESSSQSLMSSTDSKFMEKKTLVTMLIAQQCQNSGVSFDLDALSNDQIQKMEISEIKQVVEQYIQGKDRSNLNQTQSQFYYQLEQIDQTESQNQEPSEQQISIVEQDQTFNIEQKVKGAAKTDLQRNDEKKAGKLSTESGDIFESEVEGAAESEEAKEVEDIESFEQSPKISTRDQPGVNMIERRQENIEIEVTIENKEDQVNDQQVRGYQNVINPLMIQADQMKEQKNLKVSRRTSMNSSQISHDIQSSIMPKNSMHLPPDSQQEQPEHPLKQELSETSEKPLIQKSSKVNDVMQSPLNKNFKLGKFLQKTNNLPQADGDELKKIKEIEQKISKLENEERENQELLKLKMKCKCPNEQDQIGNEDQKDRESESEEDVEEIDELSYKKLIKYIEKFHPVHPITKEKFSVWDRITVQDFYSKLLDPFFIHMAFNRCKRCARKYYKMSRGEQESKDDRREKKPETLEGMPDSGSSTSDEEDESGFGGLTAAGAHLGVGAILYLQTMKTMTVLFLVLTILNLPVYFLYSQTTLNNKYGNLDIAFQYFTYGNFGGKLKMCSSTEIDFKEPQTSFNLKCDRGYHYMTDIAFYGFLYQKDPRMQNKKSSGKYQCEQISGKDYGREPIDGSRLLQEEEASVSEDTEAIITQQQNLVQDATRIQVQKNNTFNNLDTLCQSNSKMMFADDSARSEINKYFQETCLHKESCTWDFDAMQPRPFRSIISQFCKDRITPESESQEPITSNQFIFVVECQGSTYKIQSLELHKQQIACICVLIDITSIMFMFYVFKRIQTINALYIEKIDANQITMKDFSIQVNNTILDKYTQDIRLVKMKIWLHFTRRFREFQIRDNDYEVCDVVLSLSNQPETLQIFKMEQIQGEINTIKSKLATNEYVEAMYFQKQEELEDLKDQYERQKDRYKQIIEEQRKVREQLGIVHQSHRIKMIDYIFVTFKNVECVDKVIEVMQKEPQVSKLVRCIFCIKNKKVTEKEFLKQEMDVREAIEPDEILWESLKQVDAKGGGKTVLIYLVAFFFIISSSTIQIVLEGLRYDVNYKDAPILCPDSKTKRIKDEEAWKDAKSDSPLGLMTCYCIQEYKQNVLTPWVVALMDFKEVDPEEKDDFKYCLPWFRQQAEYTTIRLISALSIPILNAVISWTFKRLGQYQMMHTTIQTTLNSFWKITAMEFLNTGFLMIFISLSGTNKLFIHYENFQIKPEKEELRYDGFDSDWYFDVGRVITLTVFISCFVANIIDLQKFIVYYFKQSQDRKFSMNIKKFPTDEDDDQPNTIKHVQEDLESLYTGKDFECETTLSRMMSITLTVLFFSSGMPILYFIAFIFYLLTFMVNKLLIMQYYRRTDSILSREIPQFQIKILYYAILAKMFMGLVMINNPSIIETRDMPTDEQIPFYFDVKAQVTQNVQKAGSAKLDDTLGSQMDKSSDYIQYLHQQIYVIFVFGSIALYLFIKYGWRFTKLIYNASIGMVITIALKIWYLIKFVITLIYVKIQQSKRLVKKNSKKAAQQLKRGVSKANINVALGDGLKKQFTKDFKNVKAQLDKAEAEKSPKKDLKSDDEDSQLSKEKKESSNSDANSEENDKKSAISSVNAANAVEEATRKMMELAAKAYEEKTIKARDERLDYSDNFYKEINMISLNYIYDAAQKDYEDFKDLFKINHATQKFMYERQVGTRKKKLHILRENFLELCYMSNINEEDVKEYEDLLWKRIKTIETVIDSHFNLIKKTIIEEAKERKEREIEKTYAKESYRQKIEQRIIEHKFIKNLDLQFEGNDSYYTYEKKLEKLMEHQDALIRNEKEHINNRRHIQRICRMKGSIAQSYFIFDNPQYQVARKIYYGLYAEEQEIREQQEIDDVNEYQSESSDSDMEQSPSLNSFKSQDHDITRNLENSQNNLLTDHELEEIETHKVDVKLNKRKKLK